MGAPDNWTLTDKERAAIKLFLADAYYSHEIDPGDYAFLRTKVEGIPSRPKRPGLLTSLLVRR